MTLLHYYEHLASERDFTSLCSDILTWKQNSQCHLTMRNAKCSKPTQTHHSIASLVLYPSQFITVHHTRLSEIQHQDTCHPSLLPNSIPPHNSNLTNTPQFRTNMQFRHSSLPHSLPHRSPTKQVWPVRMQVHRRLTASITLRVGASAGENSPKNGRRGATMLVSRRYLGLYTCDACLKVPWMW
jgi:hypothetical protein